MSETIRRAKTNGFCKETIEKRLTAFKKYSGKIPLRSWRKFSIVMTTIEQYWKYNDLAIIISHFCPFGMKDFYSRMLSADKCKNFNVLPIQVKDDLKVVGVSSKDYK